MSEETKVNQEELKEEQKAEDLERAAGEAEAEKMPEDDAAEAEASGESDEKEEDAKAENTEEDEALNTKYLRLMADFQNYKRRAEKEKGDIYAYANEKIVVELLDVLDNFERALQYEDDFQTADGCLRKIRAGRNKSTGRGIRSQLPQCSHDGRQSRL